MIVVEVLQFFNAKGITQLQRSSAIELGGALGG